MVEKCNFGYIVDKKLLRDVITSNIKHCYGTLIEISEDELYTIPKFSMNYGNYINIKCKNINNFPKDYNSLIESEDWISCDFRIKLKTCPTFSSQFLDITYIISLWNNTNVVVRKKYKIFDHTLDQWYVPTNDNDLILSRFASEYIINDIKTNYPLFNNAKMLKEIIVPECFTKLTSNFISSGSDGTDMNVEKIVVNGVITEIGKDVFIGCKKIDEICITCGDVIRIHEDFNKTSKQIKLRLLGCKEIIILTSPTSQAKEYSRIIMKSRLSLMFTSTVQNPILIRCLPE